jgi:putative endonuclease
MTPSAKKSAYRFGRLAELLCCWRLRLTGYRILHRGYRASTGEIDIIARRGNTLAFIEVKARNSIADSMHALQPRQRRRIERTALVFIGAHSDLESLDFRFDLMAVTPWRIPAHLTAAWMMDE